MSSAAKDIKTNQAETVGNESVGDKLGYDKDSKERLPWEHYLQQYQSADPEEIAQRLGISYDKEQKLFTLKFLGTVFFISWPEFEIMILDSSLWKLWCLPELLPSVFC